MAQQKITVEFEPQSVDRLRRAITQAIADGRVTPGKAASIVEPVTIQSPDGERFLFIDQDNQEHWVASRTIAGAESLGWRQAWFRAR
jgi:hypothetical protein